MRFSLLYRNNDEAAHIPDEALSELLSNSIYDLSIDKIADTLCRSSDAAASFLDILKKPLKHPDDITYRQNILLDFVAMPKLLDDLRLIFKSYDSLQSDWHELRSSVYSYGMPGTIRGILDSTYESLKITAAFARNTVSYFRSIHDTVEKYDVASAGLLGIKDFCAQMTANESLDEISRIAAYFMRDSIDAYDFKVKTIVDDTLTIRFSSLTEAVEIENRSLGNSIKKLFKKNPASKDTAPEIDMGEFHLDEAQKILSEALYELYSTLSSITGNIYEFFQGLSAELSFYDTALKYCRYLSQAALPMCMPGILPESDDSFKANGLYDILLVAEGLSADDIVTNNLRFSPDTYGLLLRGPNSSGKTSFIRAIGTAQFFAQAGLPVCATAASISIRNAVFTHFSSSEKDFFTGDVAGRFEGEVQDLALILDNLRPFSLLLLNETFQTTSYSEGAEGMRHILQALPRASVKFVFVTRLLQLFDSLDDKLVKMLEFSDDLPFKLRDI